MKMQENTECNVLFVSFSGRKGRSTTGYSNEMRRVTHYILGT